MRRLVALSAVLVLAAAADQGARVLAEAQLADRARRAADGAGGGAQARASIASFPFLGRLAVSGSIARVRVRVERSLAGPLRLAAVEVDARGVKLDRSRLLAGRVEMEGIDAGTVSVELDGPALSEALKVPVTVAGGRVATRVRGVGVSARPEVDADGSLVLRVAGVPGLTVPLDRVPLAPCAATSVAVAGDRVRLSCRMDRLPPVLRR